MALATNTLYLNQILSFTGGFSVLRSKLAAALKRRRTYHQVFAELSSLSNRELADINVTRSNIDSIARNSTGL
ncbi:MAG: DUF1127 domain-containing protein [Amylibacter sp.]|jgi:uncharacterized protein YjiS (DUF1127 family)|tara:strand:- start:5856 stop:6074 length:219 start_codon:yes stop_codon:yes gene_type:complete